MEDVMVLVCHVICQDDVIKASSDFSLVVVISAQVVYI